MNRIVRLKAFSSVALNAAGGGLYSLDTQVELRATNNFKSSIVRGIL